MALQLLNLRLHQAVDKTVTALSLGTAHDHEVKIILFDHRVRHPDLQPRLLCHPGRNLITVVHSGPLDLLPQFPERGADLHPEHFIQIGIGVRIHSQHRLFSMAAQILNDQAAQCGLSHAAFSGHRDNMSHFLTSESFY